MTALNDIYLNSKEKFQQALGHLQLRMRKLQTGRASPGLIEEIEVVVYGSTSMLKHVAQITTEGAHTLWVTPFDSTTTMAIEKAIRHSGGGLNAALISGSLIKVQSPPLTENRRREIVKQMKSEVEQTAIAMRTLRRQWIEQFKRSKKEKLLSEDEAQAREKQVQRAMDEAMKQLQQIEAQKEVEILSI